VLVEWRVPAGSSTTKAEPKIAGVMRKGSKSATVFIIRLSLSTNKTSIGKRMKNVCTELQGLMTRASPAFKLFLPRSPLILFQKVSATKAFSARAAFLVLLIISI